MHKFCKGENHNKKNKFYYGKYNSSHLAIIEIN